MRAAAFLGTLLVAPLATGTGAPLAARDVMDALVLGEAPRDGALARLLAPRLPTRSPLADPIEEGALRLRAETRSDPWTLLEFANAPDAVLARLLIPRVGVAEGGVTDVPDDHLLAALALTPRDGPSIPASALRDHEQRVTIRGESLDRASEDIAALRGGWYEPLVPRETPAPTRWEAT